MGLCLSCLGSNQSTEEDEQASMLSDDKAKIVEEELLNELRNRQLNAILNSTNDHLIDISAMKMMSNYGSNSHHDNETDDMNSTLQHDDNDVFKVIPIPSSTIKQEIEKQMQNYSAKYGENTVRKYLKIIEPNSPDANYTIDFV
ncbi:unnamed protein product [Pichia kudriavzevii]